MIIIGITGTIGAGKGTIVEYLVKNKNFIHFSVREYLLEIIKKKGLPLNRDSMVLVANELRKLHSPSYIIEELYKRAVSLGRDSVIESIRTEGEVLSLRQKGNFWLIAVDADPIIRYNRILQRKSETDNVTFEEFLENEKREMYSTDPNKQNISKCIEMADFVVKNNGTIESLNNQIEKILYEIGYGEK